MPARKRVPPSSLSQLSQRFIAWRNKRSRGERIPESLWDAAVKAAQVHGVNFTARTLQLGYSSLQKRVGNASNLPPSSAFVELPTSVLPAASECIIEWEDASGGRMRVHVKGQPVPDVLALSRSFWGAD